MSDEVGVTPLARAVLVRRPIEEAYLARLRALDDTLFPRVDGMSEASVVEQLMTALWPDREVSESLIAELTAMATVHAQAGVHAGLYARAASALDWALADALGAIYGEVVDGRSLQQRVHERSALVLALLERARRRAERAP